MDERRGDAFAKLLGAEVTQSGGGSARARLRVTADHLNPHGTAHGSFLFALAGIALAAAANDSEHTGVVSAVHIDYLSPAREGDELVAEADSVERLEREDIFAIRVLRGADVVARASGRANRRLRTPATI